MSLKRISDLDDATTLDGTELVPLVQGGVTVKAPVSGLGGGGASLPAGGLQGTALVKKSNADGDVGWDYPSPIDGGTFN